MPTLYLVRHGQTDWNTQGRLQGHADRPLDVIGRLQAAAIGHRLSTVSLDAIHASDLSRAMSTARAIAIYHGLPVNAEPRLREVDFGVWEGRTMTELSRLYPDQVAAWRANHAAFQPAGAESPEDVRLRLKAFLDELRTRPAGERILLVAHGGSLRTLLSLIVPLPDGNTQRPIVGTASISTIELGPAHGSILTLDDRSHLLEIDESSRFSVLS